MSQTIQSDTSTDGPDVAKQDAWIASVTGVVVDRPARRAAANAELIKRVTEVDTAMAGLTDAAKAVTAPENRKVLDAVTSQLGRRRDAMAAASEADDVAKQLASAPALLQDIAKATVAAQRIAAPQSAPTQSGQEQPAAGPVADFFKGVGHAIGDAATTVAHGVADAATTVGHAIGDAATTVAHGVADAASTIGTAASVLAHKITQKPAKECLDTLKRWTPVFAGIKQDNPVGRQFDLLTTQLTTAEAMPGGLAREDALDKIADAAVAADKAAKQAFEANILVEQHFAAVERNLKDLALPDPQKGAVIAQRDKLRGDYDHAYATAATADELLTALTSLKTDTGSLQAQSISVADATAQVVSDLKQAKAEIDKLKDEGKKADFTKQYDALQARLTDAGKIAEIGPQKQALFTLGHDAVGLLESVTKLQFTEQAATPAGKKQIDDMIKGFGDISHDPAQQALCKAAIAACYKVPLDIPDGMEMSRLPALYNMMTQIPAGDLEGLGKVEYETDPTIGASYYFKKKVVLTQLGGEGNTHDMENQADPTKTKKADYFKMTALHELGHYVDDKHKVMDGGRGKAELGGWLDSNVDQVAQAFYDRSLKGFVGTGKTPTQADLLTLLGQLLKTGKATKPADAAAPLGTLLADWDAIMANAGCTDCLRVRDAGKSPWNTMVPAGDGRAYHEGYAGIWYSYPVSERPKGISNYQFRAPAEWFAEQFAYFRMFNDKTPPAALARYLTTS